MALPLRVQNAFRYGHSLAAEVTPRKPGARAWVRVKPILRGGKTEQQVREGWTLTRQADAPYDGTVSKYLVRYLELTSWNAAVDYDYGMEYRVRQRTLHDEEIEVSEEASLIDWLSRYVTDLDMLRKPEAVDYLFEE
jgi:hypothetical protein